jgi:hypothetical protein
VFSLLSTVASNAMLRRRSRLAAVSRLIGSAGIATVAAVAMSVPANAAVSWVQIATPDAAGSDFDQLLGTAVVSSSEAWSVGIMHSPADTEIRPLIEHWTSARGWQVTASAPIVSGTDARVVAVAATSATDAWAVGQLGNTPAVNHGLFEHWNGSAWSRVSGPAAEPADSTLAGVAAISSTDVWAVGEQINPTSLQSSPLFEHWNGSAWSVVAGPALGQDARLTGVAAVSANDVWAVGRIGEAALTEHWNGTSWSRVAVAPPRGESSFHAVAATAGNDVWAVGIQGVSTLVEHWNGSAWSVVVSPNGSNTVNTLAAATVLSASDVWAVGLSTSLGVYEATVTEHWDGTSWSVVASPNVPGAFGTKLLGVSGRPGGPLLAVGTTHASDGSYHAFGISG